MSKNSSAIGGQYLRRAGVRPTAPRITIVCDDTRTAPNYFATLKKHLSGCHSARPILDVKKACHHGVTPEALIYFAGKFTQGLGKDDWVWVLIDLETSETEPRKVSDLRSKSPRDRKFPKPAVSKPCFEVWTLHHVVGSGRKLKDCSSVNVELRKVWKKEFGCDFGNKKADADYSKIVGRYKVAAERSDKQRRQGQCHSEVCQIIEEIRRHLELSIQGSGEPDRAAAVRQ